MNPAPTEANRIVSTCCGEPVIVHYSSGAVRCMQCESGIPHDIAIHAVKYECTRCRNFTSVKTG